MKRLMALAITLTLCAFVAQAQQSTATATAKTTKRKSVTKTDPAVAAQLNELKEAIGAQQQQIGQLSEQVQSRDQQIQQLQQQLDQVRSTATAAQSDAASAKSAASQQQQSLGQVQGDLTDMKTNLTNTALTLQEEQKKPRPDSIELAGGKIKIGALFYGDYAMYYQTGFGPQFLTQINQPGPGNDRYNTFDVSRAYINFLFSPSDAITFRVTPNIYRQIGAASATKFGAVSGIGANTDGELAFRLKYAYMDWNKLFAGSDALKEDKLTIGQQQNPLVDWEENLYGYRWVNLTPWNYLSLSSSQVGVSLHGPIKFGGKQYLDYGVGVFNNASFRQLEQSEQKQGMARISFYPLGAKSNYEGLGLTAFGDFGSKNVTPDTGGKGAARPLYRLAALAHYQLPNGALIAYEYDYGRNAFSSGNLFSGSGPADEFGIAATPTAFANFDALARALQNSDGTIQQGWDLFGRLPLTKKSKLSLFGMYQFFKPNTRVSVNPLDFERVVAGISYKYNSHLQFAVDSQNLFFRHSQFTFPSPELALFDPKLAAANPNGIPNAVPTDTQGVFMNVEFSF